MRISGLKNPFNRNEGESRKPNENDLGFGTSITTSGQRLINRDGSFNIVRRGLAAWRPYQSLVEISWGHFLGVVVLFYIATNALFAALFVAIGVDTLSGVQVSGTMAGDFAAAFFFSIQTFTTVGYGAMSPVSPAANVVASLDALVGLMSFALATGLLFARFSKPVASILFSRHAVIRPYRDTPYQSFQFQIVNRRNNRLINLNAKLTMSWVETVNGEKVRRYALLELEREQVFLFPLNWVVVHIIDKDSPLWAKSEEEVRAMEPEFIILIQGYDETFAQDVHANSSYTCDEVFWNKRFERMYYPGEHGRTVLELERVHNLVPLEEEE
ncbi:MAG: transporter [Phaeodactylibacter sp.]|nr:transporter [Phaeodactylibacter sp.]MCB9263550.1 transporter [Lewinellaceae bacterium]MCB9287573.1 transporter [Lewinellaceae bacterium]